MDNHGKHEPSAWSSSSMQVANSYLNSTEGTLASYDEIKVAWCVKTDALDEHKQRRDIWALESNVQITTPEMYVCKLESRFGGEAVRNLLTVLLCTPNRRNDGFTLEQDRAHHILNKPI